MQVRFKIFSLLLASSSPLFANGLKNNYYEGIKNTSSFKKVRHLCKSTSLSFTCGDHICNEGENNFNCPNDCDEHGNDFIFETKKSGSYNARTWCDKVQEVRDPENLNQIQEAILYAKSKGLRIKPLGASHTDNEAICTDGIVITSRNLSTIYGLEEFEGLQTVHVQSGVTIGDLGAWLHLQRKGLGFAVVGYEKVRIGGIIGTGAHGSGIAKPHVNNTSLLSDRIVSMRLVLADGSIKEFTRGTTGKTDPKLWGALRVHLGMFGYIHDIRMEVEDDFHIKAHSIRYSDKDLFSGESVWKFVKNCDTAHVNWFPYRKRYDKNNGHVVVHCGKRERKQPNQTWNQFDRLVHKDAQYALHLPHVSNWMFRFYKFQLHRAVCTPNSVCYLEHKRKDILLNYPPYEYRSGISNRLTAKSGIRGWAHIMQNSHGSPQGDSFRQTDWEVAIPISEAAEAFKALREIFADTETKQGTCLPLIGLYMRFGVVNDTLISHAAQGGNFKLGEPVIFLEIPEFLPSFDIKDQTDVEHVRKLMHEYEAPFREFIFTMVEKVGARIHWAKNRKELFSTTLKEEVRASQLAEFKAQVFKLDPEGWFSNDFSEMLGINSFYGRHSEEVLKEKL